MTRPRQFLRAEQRAKAGDKQHGDKGGGDQGIVLWVIVASLSLYAIYLVWIAI